MSKDRIKQKTMDTNQHEPLEGMTHVISWIRMLTQSEKEGTGWDKRD